MQTYLLPEHVHVCRAGSDAIFLNARSDEYFGLDREQTRMLGLLLKGWEPAASSAEVPEAHTAELADVLVARGLLSAQSGRAVTPIPFQPAQRALLAWDAMSPKSVRGRHVLHFARSYLTAKRLMRFGGFEQVLRRVQTLREQSTQTFSRGAAEELLSSFYHVRPFFYGKAGKCLLDSVVLALIMGRCGFLPQWIIGVRTRPFGAHCWLQHEDVVLNGTPEYVRAYTPILAI